MNLDSVRRLIHRTDWKSIRLSQMLWFPKMDVGWLPVEDEIEYDDEYFRKFEEYRSTDLGRQIIEFRIKWVKSFYESGPLVDIGVGTGHFIEECGIADTRGYDISSYGTSYLKDRDLYVDPYQEPPEAISCWDSLEHIKDCWTLIQRVRSFVFLSVPICQGPEHAISFKHYKPREHWWYFTTHGIIKCFNQMGFTFIASSLEETKLGRSHIETFVFRRIK